MKKIYYTLLLAETILGVIIGAFFLSIADLNLAMISFAISSFFVFLSVAIPLKSKLDMEEIVKRSVSNVDLLDLPMKINEKEMPELEECAQKILSKARRGLKLLSEGILSDQWFYDWICEQYQKCEKTVRNVTLMDEEEWEKNPNERTYYEENREARYRNVKVERIFVTTGNRMRNKTKRKIILKHIIDNIKTYIVLDQNVKGFDWNEIEKGFTIYDDRLMYIDVLPSRYEEAGGKLAAGRIVKATDKIKEMKKRYRTLLSFAKKDKPFDFLCRFVGRDELFNEMIGVLEERYDRYEKLKELVQKEKQPSHQNDLKKWTEILEQIGKTE